MMGKGATALSIIVPALRREMVVRRRRPFVLGLCGAQGSGKTTLSEALAGHMRAAGIPTAVLSIDDLYGRAERQALARDIHPLFAVRGVPGTHDVARGIAILDALDRGSDTLLPRFDKSRDDRSPPEAWDHVPGDTALFILEGWCVGARPQPAEAMEDPVNGLEREEDRNGRWRRTANATLAGDYQRLFARLDMLVLLAAPGFETVRDWRIEQEHGLARRAGRDAPGVMSDAEIGRFIQFYERLTRHILSEMPDRADITIALAPDRAPHSVSGAAAGTTR